jgi:hypothetical protein
MVDINSANLNGTGHWKSGRITYTTYILLANCRAAHWMM